MRLAIIDYHLRQPDHLVCAQAKAWGLPALELSRTAPLPEHRWLARQDGAGRWYSAATALGIALDSISATFAYEWPPIDRQYRLDSTSIGALAELVETAGYLNIPVVHVPLLELPAPRQEYHQKNLLAALGPSVDIARDRRLRLCLETYWPVSSLRELCEAEPGVLQVSLDSGNIVALGRNPVQEMAELGSHLGQLRVRERRRHEIFRSLPIGHGDVPWSALQQQIVSMANRPQLVLAATGGATLMEAYASATRLLYQLVQEPHLSRVA